MKHQNKEKNPTFRDREKLNQNKLGVKKFLGQNFLNNKNILVEMSRAAELSKKDVVLEVGPGLGTLTEILAHNAKKVIAVEKDKDLIPILQEKFRNIKNVKILERDILEFEDLPLIPSLSRRSKESVVTNYKIVANIPYYITSRFLKIFLSEVKIKPKLMVLMVQREVAERILAKDEKESLLSLSVKAYADVKLIRRVPSGAFNPPPKVDSAIIKIIPFNAPLKIRGSLRGEVMNVEKILSIARVAFQQKRKMLRHSIGKKISLPEKFKEKRPEELTLKDWASIV